MWTITKILNTNRKKTTITTVVNPWKFQDREEKSVKENINVILASAFCVWYILFFIYHLRIAFNIRFDYAGKDTLLNCVWNNTNVVLET